MDMREAKLSAFYKGVWQETSYPVGPLQHPILPSACAPNYTVLASPFCPSPTHILTGLQGVRDFSHGPLSEHSMGLPSPSGADSWASLLK